jgi:hypothetical protein
MINGDIDIFIDTIHYGQDIYLAYSGKKFLIDGWWENGIYTLRMVDLDNPKEKSIFNFEISNEDNEIVVNKFLNKKIWNGKSFLEEAKNIEWYDP